MPTAREIANFVEQSESGAVHYSIDVLDLPKNLLPASRDKAGDGRFAFDTGDPLRSRATLTIIGHIPESAILAPSYISVDNPRLTFARVLNYFGLGEVRDDTTYYNGQPGFGYVRDEKRELVAFPHLRHVVVGEDVTIGRYTCIDNGALTDTVIEDGVKIDNLCHIAHGAHIGAHTSIAALTCIEGSVKIGKRCTIGSNVTFQIGSGCGDDVTVGSGSVVTKFIPSGETWVGVPARKLR